MQIKLDAHANVCQSHSGAEGFYLFRFQISCFKSILAFGAHFLVIYRAYETLWRIINGLMFFMVQLLTCFILKIHNQKVLFTPSVAHRRRPHSTSFSLEAFESLSWHSHTYVTHLTIGENENVARSLDIETNKTFEKDEKNQMNKDDI